MKSKTLTIVALVLLMAMCSCEKPVIPDVGTEGNLEVRIATIEQVDFPTFATRATLEDVCTRLNFLVYDSLGNRVAYDNQTSDQKGFGTADFQLSSGKYQVVVVAQSSQGNPTSTKSNKIQFTKATGFSDTFYSNNYVVVSDDAVTVDAKLSRNVSLCRVQFNDSIPQNISKMRFEYSGGSGSFDAATGLGVKTTTKQEMTFAVETGSDSAVFDLYTFLPEDAESIHLKAEAYASDNKLVCSREFDIPMKPRQITKFSGSFFSGSSGSSITIIIGINTDWDGEQEVNF